MVAVGAGRRIGDPAGGERAEVLVAATEHVGRQLQGPSYGRRSRSRAAGAVADLDVYGDRADKGRSRYASMSDKKFSVNSRIRFVAPPMPVLSHNWIGAKVNDDDALEAGEAGLHRDDLDA